MSSKFAVYVGIAVATVLVHVVIAEQREISQLRGLVSLTDQRAKIQDDEIRDLIANLHDANQKSEALKTQGYVAGIVDVLERKDQFMQIWHHGYDRGAAVQVDMERVVREQQKDSKMLESKTEDSKTPRSGQ